MDDEGAQKEVTDNLPLPYQGNGTNHTTVCTLSSPDFPKARSGIAVVIEPLVQSESNHTARQHLLQVAAIASKKFQTLTHVQRVKCIRDEARLLPADTQ